MTFGEFVSSVAAFEGFVENPYKDPAGVWTIGYGRTAGVNESTPPTTMKEEIEWLENYLTRCKVAVRNELPDVTENCILALTDFYFNCGPGNFKRLVHNRTITEILTALPLYNKAGGKKLEGLVRRRKWEKELAESPDNIREGHICVKWENKWLTFTGECATIVNTHIAIFNDAYGERYYIPEETLYQSNNIKFVG